jgi:hypothetical protein
MSNNGEIYYFKTSELALLLVAGGVKSLYGIKMDIDNLDKKAVYEAMFGLQKKGMLCGDGQKLSMSDSMSKVIGSIKDSGVMLMYLNRTPEKPQRFVYMGNMYVIISPYGLSGDIYQLEIADGLELEDKISGEWFVLEQALNDEMLYDENPVVDMDIEENAEKLLQSDINVISGEQWGTAVCCMRLVTSDGQQCIKQYLLMQKGLNDYIAVSGMDGTKVYAYSVRKLLEILKDDMGVLR